MKKLLTIASMVILTITACQHEDLTRASDLSELIPNDRMTSVDLSDLKQIEEPIIYLADTDFERWTTIQSLEERIASCNPSQEHLKRMSTYAIVKSMVHHPLNHILFTYDEPLELVNILAESSTVHKELETRSDAADLIIKIFEISEIEMDPKAVDRTRYDLLSYDDEMFLEYYIASGRLRFYESQDYLNKLKQILVQKIKNRQNQPKRYSLVSLRPLYMIATRVGLHGYDSITSTGVPMNSAGIIYTPLGQAIVADSYTEGSPDEILNWETDATTLFPYANMVGSATRLYNCHSYAWHSQSTSNTKWINNSNNQISKYWTADLYIPTDQNHATKIFYNGGDHSAIAINNGMYRSKWGYWPLMEHSPRYCPYFSSDLRFFKERSRTVEINGSDHVSPGQTAIYYRGAYNDLSPTYEWSIESYMSNQDSSLPTLTSIPTADYVHVSFYSEGYYLIKLKVYVRNILFATGEKPVIVY